MTYDEQRRQGESTTFEHLSRAIQSRTDCDRDILCITAMNSDHLYAVEAIQSDYETAVAEVASSPGGSGADTAAGLALLGTNTAVAGIVGDDSKGNDLRSSLESTGVNCSLVMTGRGRRTGEAVVLATRKQQGGRMIVVYPGINNDYGSTLRSEGLDQLIEAANRSRIVHLSSFVGRDERELQEQIIRNIDERTVVSLNPGNIYASLGLDAVMTLMGRADIVFFYENMLNQFLRLPAEESTPLNERLLAFGERIADAQARRPSVFVVKRSWSADQANYLVLCDQLGKRGHWCSARVGLGPADTVVDPTGAGDAMAAGVLFSLLIDLRPDDAVDLAYVMAMSVSTKLGARDGLPRLNELEAQWTKHMHGYRRFPSALRKQIP